MYFYEGGEVVVADAVPEGCRGGFGHGHYAFCCAVADEVCLGVDVSMRIHVAVRRWGKGDVEDILL